MNVLSLFDGMSCGQIALNRAGIKYEKYFASEIDKHAMKVTQHNFPNTIQLGDVKNVCGKDLPKIDLIIGGSPCQGFSFAGKGLNFEDERSKLFFEFVRLLKECNPKYFLLENVRMKYEYEIIISKYLGLEPIYINSNLVSAQNRERVYWTNINAKPYNLFGDFIADIPQPKDKGIYLKDILETEINEKYFLKDGHAGVMKDKMQKAGCLTGGAHSGGNHSDMTLLMYQLPHGTNPGGEVAKDGKVPSMTKSAWEHNNLLVQGGDYRSDEGFRWRDNGKSPTLMARAREDKYGVPMVKSSKRKHHQDAINNIENKANCLVVGSNLNSSHFTKTEIENRIRRLTPIECERLQTVPDNYTNIVSDSQRYKMLGNGWTVDIIMHILNFIV